MSCFFFQSSMCYIHSAALVAEYLRVKGLCKVGCASFKSISPNILPDENIAKDDEGDTGETRYTTVSEWGFVVTTWNGDKFYVNARYWGLVPVGTRLNDKNHGLQFNLSFKDYCNKKW